MNGMITPAIMVSVLSRFCTAFASRAIAAKALAEKGYAAAQYRYPEMLHDGRGVVKAKVEGLGSAATQLQEKMYRCG